MKGEWGLVRQYLVLGPCIKVYLDASASAPINISFSSESRICFFSSTFKEWFFCCSRMMSKMKRTHLLMQQLPKCAKCTWGNGNCTAAKICKINITIYIVTWNLTFNYTTPILVAWFWTIETRVNQIWFLNFMWHLACLIFDGFLDLLKVKRVELKARDTRYLSSKLLREKSRKLDSNLKYKLGPYTLKDRNSKLNLYCIFVIFLN